MPEIQYTRFVNTLQPDIIPLNSEVEKMLQLKGRLTQPGVILFFVSLFLLLLFVWIPGHALATGIFVFQSLVRISPLVIPGILLASWITASGLSNRVAAVFERCNLVGLLMAAAVGTVTPVCGVTVLPLMAALLASGVPLSSIMAFWLSSPITDPAMLSATAATLGIKFAIGKMVGAFMLGIFGGIVTMSFSRRSWALSALRDNAITGSLCKNTCECSMSFGPAIWKDRGRLTRFKKEVWGITRLILICLVPAFAAEYALNAVLRPEAVSAYVGHDTWWAIPVAVFVGAPAYIDGYAALPLTRALLDNGMSQGAAMAFLISGGVVSIWGAMAIFPVLKVKPFLLYLVLALTGSLAAGWLFELFVFDNPIIV